MPLKNLLVVLSLLIAAPGAIAQDSPGEPVEARDEVVREVVRMLEAGVGEEVILLWLAREGLRPAALSSDDVIALTRSDASRELIDTLMQAPGSARLPAPAARTPDPQVSSRPDSPAGTVPVTLSIAYRPYRDPEGDEDDQWHLFVYLDGRPLAWSDGRNWLSKSRRNRVVSFDASAGPHVVRLAQERHRRRGGDWSHEARVSPDAIEFDGGGGGPPIEIEIEIKDPAGLGFGKAAYRWARLEDGEVVEQAALSERPQTWTPLCEEIEANWDAGRKIPKRVRKQLEACVRWGDLWPQGVGAPDRATVRQRLEQHDFRPLAASD